MDGWTPVALVAGAYDRGVFWLLEVDCLGVCSVRGSGDTAGFHNVVVRGARVRATTGCWVDSCMLFSSHIFVLVSCLFAGWCVVCFELGGRESVENRLRCRLGGVGKNGRR